MRGKTGYLPNYYARLGVPINATMEEIRSAYRAAVRRLHPDVNPDEGAADLLQEVLEAYEVLSDATKRAEYDRLLGADASSVPAVLVNVLYSRPALVPHPEPQLLYALLTMLPLEEEPQTETPALNVCLVLDKSTSMRGVRMDTVKATALKLLEQLRPQDTFSVVAFSDRASVVIPASQNIQMEVADARIRMLAAGGGTEIFQGLEAGYRQVLQYHRPTSINHLFLITDGRTYGDEDRCLELADRCASQGIRISCLGIGHEWNDRFLDDLASRTGGTTVFAANPKELQRFLGKQFQNLNRVFAESVTARLNLPPEVTLRYAIRLLPSTAEIPIGETLSLGAIAVDVGLKVLLEFLVPPIDARMQEFALADLHLDMMIPSRKVPLYRVRLGLGRPVVENLPHEEPPRTIMAAMSRLVLYRLQQSAQEDIRKGNFEAATRKLTNLATQLLQQGEQDLARTVMLEAERLKQGKGLSEEGKKHIKYGTRALLLPPKERWL